MKKQSLLFSMLAFSLVFANGCKKDAIELNPKETLEISIGYWNIEQMDDILTDPLRNKIENDFQIRILPVSVDWSNYKDYYQMLSVTNSLPDIFATLTISSNDSNDSAYYETLIESGNIQPLPDDLSAYPHLKMLMQSLEYTRYSDGHFYAIPRPSFADSSLSCTDAAMIVRKDWMETLGFDAPQTLDEFIEMTTAFAKEDPDQNGLDDTIGYNVNATNALGKWLMLGIAPECNVYSWIEQDGHFIPSWYSENFRQVVLAYRELYQSGGLDPDFYIKNPNEILEDFSSGRLGALEFKSSPSSIQMLEEQWSQYNDKPFEECVDVLPIFPAPDGITYCNSSTPFWSESFISSSVNEEEMDRILSLYDFLLSEEGLFMGKYGLENIDYRITDDGTYECLLDLSKDSLLNLLEEKYPSIPLFSSLATWGGTDADFALSEMNYIRYGEYCVQLANKDCRWNKENATPITRPEAFLIFPKESSERFSTANAFQAFVKCIIGTEDPLVMWDTFITDLKDQGLDDYIKRQNDAYFTVQAEKGET